MPAPFRIRLAQLPADKAAILSFIDGLQRYEYEIEHNRRVDPEVAEEFFAVITERVVQGHGCILIAEDENGTALGWAAAHESTKDIYVIAEERTYGYISELFVREDSRGWGIGRALIAACETWAEERGLKIITIAALAGNALALRSYHAAGYTPYGTELKKRLR